MQGSNLHLWPWQADSFPSEPPGKPVYGVVGSLTDAAEFPWILARPPAPLPLKLPPALYPEQQKGRRGGETTGHHGEPVRHKASHLGVSQELEGFTHLHTQMPSLCAAVSSFAQCEEPGTVYWGAWLDEWVPHAPCSGPGIKLRSVLLS